MEENRGNNLFCTWLLSKRWFLLRRRLWNLGQLQQDCRSLRTNLTSEKRSQCPKQCVVTRSITRFCFANLWPQANEFSLLPRLHCLSQGSVCFTTTTFHCELNYRRAGPYLTAALLRLPSLPLSNTPKGDDEAIPHELSAETRELEHFSRPNTMRKVQRAKPGKARTKFFAYPKTIPANANRKRIHVQRPTLLQMSQKPQILHRNAYEEWISNALHDRMRVYSLIVQPFHDLANQAQEQTLFQQR